MDLIISPDLIEQLRRDGQEKLKELKSEDSADRLKLEPSVIFNILAAQVLIPILTTVVGELIVEKYAQQIKEKTRAEAEQDLYSLVGKRATNLSFDKEDECINIVHELLQGFGFNRDEAREFVLTLLVRIRDRQSSGSSPGPPP